MNTNYDDESTRYPGIDETTHYEEVPTPAEPPAYNTPSSKEAKAKKKDGKNSGWKRAAATAGGGILIGGLGSALMAMKGAGDDGSGGSDGVHHRESLSHPEWVVDDEIKVATSVDDNMSFSQAFAAARAEVGAGGCFEWHGKLYGTYYADEWNSMTPAQRAEYGNHFSWNHIDHSSSHVAQHSTTAHTGETAQTTTPTDGGDDINVVSVNHESSPKDAQDPDPDPFGTDEILPEDVVSVQGEPEIEILGVIHDGETGANIGELSVDGQEVVLIDVDGNMEFDYLASDQNVNGQLEGNEIADIQGQGITVNDLGGFTDGTGDMLADNDDMCDYSSDVYGG